MALIKHCRSVLLDAEKRIEEIAGDEPDEDEESEDDEEESDEDQALF